MLLTGILLPIPTPFYSGGEVYYKKLEHNVERYSRTPASGIAVLGSTGESWLLSGEERRNVLRIAIAAAAPEKVMIAGTGLQSALETLRLTEYAAALNYDAVCLSVPHLHRRQMGPANTLAFYRFLADRSPLPVLIGNAPSMTGCDIPMELVGELAQHANIIGIAEENGADEKLRAITEASRSVKRTVTVTERFEAVTGRMLAGASTSTSQGLLPAETLATIPTGTSASAGSLAAAKPSSSAVQSIGKLRTRQKAVGFQVLAGAAQQLLASFQAGAAGTMAAFAAAAPTACYEVYAAFKDGDLRLAAEKQERITRAAARIVDELGIPALKYAMDLNGYYGGNSRLPWLPLDAATKADIERLMINIRS